MKRGGKEADIALSDLLQAFSYDPDTGVMRWRLRAANRIHIGDVAGTPSCRQAPYLRCRYLGVNLKVHRIAWCLMTGSWPDGHIDHINLDKGDNRWSNLRLATRSQNSANTPLRADNPSGFKGVRQEGRKFRATIKENGKNRCLGFFQTAEAAHSAYVTAAIRVFGDFARVA